MSDAIREAAKVLSAGGLACDAVDCAISFLENDNLCNAGFGSNLTLEGRVECDASIMCGRGGHFGAVGAAQGLPNPIKVSRHLMNETKKGLLLLPSLSLSLCLPSTKTLS
jgi:taspase (threonine aspartase 1)